MVSHLTANAVERQNAVVTHGEMVAVVVLRDARLDIMRRVDVDFIVEDVGRWIRSVNTAHQRLGQVLFTSRVDLGGRGPGRGGGLLLGGLTPASGEQRG